ncbi:hypothetical protein GCM10010873_16240 [Cypionkella aquatica]|uniref:Uncharacterized protein n=1 Tax=Cypionkella aquatica TaxID=1756042 RepID=A0AA37U364_9RHOB|nr:hypothetical protein [Cypionkella aquatica]GLS86650.1 hypothetical protein GCM10010873_16240 [Cypionkella aquatica]
MIKLLTSAQQAALREIDAEKVTKRNCGIGAWRIFGPVQPTVVGRVISMKLAEWAKAEYGEICVLTSAGRQALSLNQ